MMLRRAPVPARWGTIEWGTIFPNLVLTMQNSIWQIELTQRRKTQMHMLYDKYNQNLMGKKSY